MRWGGKAMASASVLRLVESIQMKGRAKPAQMRMRPRWVQGSKENLLRRARVGRVREGASVGGRDLGMAGLGFRVWVMGLGKKLQTEKLQVPNKGRRGKRKK
jgi:hypothetical protein